MHMPHIARGFRAAPIWSLIVILVGVAIYYSNTNLNAAASNSFAAIFWSIILLVVPQFFALRERHVALVVAYSLFDRLGGQSMLDENLRKLAQDALDQSSHTSDESKSRFQQIHAAMASSEWELADTMEEYLPGSDLAAAKVRRKERIQKEYEDSQ